ncbi:MAG: amidohydrolase [Xanthomonadales bacterium]|nr:amidohydrolase [Gammaproteobacteria bacterium]NNL05351.1 amidohydrolase [Xanthomonadales bacterium]
MKNILAAILIMFPALSLAGIAPAELDGLAADAQEQVVEWRRWLHQNPELGNREVNTSAYIAQALREMGLEPRTGIAHTGVVAVIQGGKPGPMVALRADIDALPVKEQTGLPFASQAKGEYRGQEVDVMHACGHDAHTSMLLGAARVLTAVQDELQGSVMLIFQPAEEGAPAGEEGGAELMLKEGIWDETLPAAVFGIHVGIGAGESRVVATPGPAMAASDRFEIRVKGRQTHGAMPWNGVDPIVTAAQIVLGLQTIASRQVDVTLAPSIVSIGRIEGGVRNNVIPEAVEMEGTIRTFDPAMRESIHERIEQTARHIAAAAGAEIEFELELGYPALINDPELYEQMLPTLQRVTDVARGKPHTTAEDFAYFAMATPGLYVNLANGPVGGDPRFAAPNHSPEFDMYEPNLEIGVRVFAHLVVDYLQGRTGSE